MSLLDRLKDARVVTPEECKEEFEKQCKVMGLDVEETIKMFENGEFSYTCDEGIEPIQLESWFYSWRQDLESPWDKYLREKSEE